MIIDECLNENSEMYNRTENGVEVQIPTRVYAPFDKIKQGWAYL